MYYSEKLIDGVMMFKTNPKSDWRTMSIEMLTTRYTELKAKS